MEFYYYSHGQRIGPIDTTALKELAQNGTIVPDVPVENDGKIYPARKVKGLFTEEMQLPPIHEYPASATETETESELGTAPRRALSPYPVRIVREPRSYTQRKRTEALERASTGTAIIAWFSVICGSIAIAVGIVIFFAGIILGGGPGAASAGLASLIISIGAGIGAFIFAEILFFFAALGKFLAVNNYS